MAQVIRRAWEGKHISQKEVHRDLGIHQSQFSKLVNGQFKGATGHAKRLFEYSIQRERSAKSYKASVDADGVRSSLTQRLMQAWDGTAEGARALESILDGVVKLRRGGKK